MSADAASPPRPGPEAGPRPLPRGDAAIAALVGFVLGALYVRTLAPTVLAADGGEFQFAAYLAGIAHPTGYPLYLILGWAWSHLLPVGDPAFRMNLFSAVWAALTVGALYLLALYLLRRMHILDLCPSLAQPVAALAAVTFGVSRIFWSQAVAAEVYSLHAFLTVLVLFLALAWDGARGSQRERLATALALAVGLALAHHGTSLLLLPGLAAYAWLQGASTRHLTRGRAARLLACLALPQLLYLYIPLRASHTPYLSLPWDPDGPPLRLYENTWQGFLEFRLGKMFAGELRLGPESLERLEATGTLLLDQFTPVGVALGLAGLLFLAWRREHALLALTALLYLAQAGFNLVYQIGDIEVFYIPTYLAFALWMGVGTGGLLDLALRRAWPRHASSEGETRSRPVGPPYRWLGSVLLLPLVSLPGFLAWENVLQVDLSQALAPREGWEAFLAADPPQGAIVVSNDRNEIMPLWYLQYVEGRRPDLTGAFPLLTQEPRFAHLGRVLEAALETGRPVVLAKAMPGLEVRFRVEERDGYWLVTGPVAFPEDATPLDGTLGGRLALLGCRLAPEIAARGSDLEVTLYWKPRLPLQGDYTTYVHLVGPGGERMAGSDHRPGGVYYPTSLWEPDDVLEDQHRLALPPDLPSGPYRLRVGAYLYPQMTELGEPLWVGEVTVR
ncbi:MAG: glycosyltransferase family 117 protein [Anaerolineae bacterium]